ncbi:MAG TPA: hypothetical protein PKA09_25655 [Geminicoccus sp.]|nr:hypothetical protein [Geminicoccus sp.]
MGEQSAIDVPQTNMRIVIPVWLITLATTVIVFLVVYSYFRGDCFQLFGFNTGWTSECSSPERLPLLEIKRPTLASFTATDRSPSLPVHRSSTRIEISPGRTFVISLNGSAAIQKNSANKSFSFSISIDGQPCGSASENRNDVEAITLGITFTCIYSGRKIVQDMVLDITAKNIDLSSTEATIRVLRLVE